MENVSIEACRNLWAERMEQIEVALKRGHDPLTIADVTAQLEEGAAQVFFAENSTAVTKIFDRGNTRFCEIWLAGGELNEVIELKDKEIEPFAREMGCDRVVIIGRRGWRPFLADYEPIQTVFMKELDDGQG